MELVWSAKYYLHGFRGECDLVPVPYHNAVFRVGLIWTAMLRDGGVSLWHASEQSPPISLPLRLVADVLNDVGKFLELLAPVFPHLFLFLVCTASVSSVSLFTVVSGQDHCGPLHRP